MAHIYESPDGRLFEFRLSSEYESYVRIEVRGLFPDGNARGLNGLGEMVEDSWHLMDAEWALVLRSAGSDILERLYQEHESVYGEAVR